MSSRDWKKQCGDMKKQLDCSATGQQYKKQILHSNPEASEQFVVLKQGEC